MTWQENLFSNLLVVGILLGLFAIIYMRVTGKNLIDLFNELKEMISPKEVIE